MDFPRLIYWQKFEDLCRLILRLEGTEFRGLEGSGGDSGIDGFIGFIRSPNDISQFKYFPGKLGSSRKKQIECSLEKAAKFNPKVWRLISPMLMNKKDWEWVESLKKKYPTIELQVWDKTELEAKVLQNQEQISAEFPELFPTLDLANKLSEKLYQKFSNDLTDLTIAQSNIELLTTYTPIPEGTKDCWERGHFRIEDIKGDYDYRRSVTDEILDLIEENIGVLVSGKSHTGKTTLTQRIIVEEIERGYLILRVSSPIPNSILLINLLNRMIRDGHRNLLVIVDNAERKGVEEILKCYNHFKSQSKVRFLFISRNIGLGLVPKLLSQDDQKELSTALSNMEKFVIEFTEKDGYGFVEKAGSLWNLKLDELQVTALGKHFYEVSRGDPLIYICMIIRLIKNKIDPNKIKNEPADPFKYLEYDFKEKINSLDHESSLWKSAICCIFLGGLGFKLSLDLLKKFGVYKDDLIKLTSIDILFDDGMEYTLRHELWGLQFLLYLYDTHFGEDFDSLDNKLGLLDLVGTLFANLSAYEIITFFNRLESVLSEKTTVKFVKSLVNKIKMPSQFNNKDLADLLCYGHGNFYNTMGDYTLAIHYYDEAIKLNPDHWSAWNNKGNVYEALNNYTKAKECYDRSIAIHPENSQASYNKAKILSKEGNKPAALESIENAIYYDPRHTWNYHEKGNILEEMGKLDDAMIFYNRSIEFDPSNAASWLNIGNTMMKLGRYDQAGFFLDRAERINPKMAEISYAKGALAKEKGKYEDAVNHFFKALELQSINLDFLRQMGIVQLRLDKPKIALEYFEKVLGLKENDIVAMGNGGICLIKLKQIREAIVNISKVYKLISTEEDKKEFQNLIKILTSSMSTFGVHITDLSITPLLDHDLLLLYIATFTDMKTVHNIAQILNINL